LCFYFIFVFVFVIDDNDTHADEARIMCLKTSNGNKSSTVYLVFISVKVRSLIYNRYDEYQVKLFLFPLCYSSFFYVVYVLCFFFVCVRYASCVQCYRCLWIVHSSLFLQLFLTFSLTTTWYAYNIM
jgi:hypothetical protein